MKFRLGETVRVINPRSRYFDKVGRVTRVAKTGHERPFGVSGLIARTPAFKPLADVLATPPNVPHDPSLLRDSRKRGGR